MRFAPFAPMFAALCRPAWTCDSLETRRAMNLSRRWRFQEGTHTRFALSRFALDDGQLRNILWNAIGIFQSSGFDDRSADDLPLLWPIRCPEALRRRRQKICRWWLLGLAVEERNPDAGVNEDRAHQSQQLPERASYRPWRPSPKDPLSASCEHTGGIRVDGFFNVNPR